MSLTSSTYAWLRETLHLGMQDRNGQLIVNWPLMQSISLPFKRSQTMNFTQQHKLISLAFYSTALYAGCGHPLD